MIVKPHRSVTRFFIPLIDVLILLFCIFLLMPFVSKSEEDTPFAPEEAAVIEAMTPASEREAIDEIERLRDRIAELERDLANLKKTRPDLAESLSVKVLQIDPANGELFTYSPERMTIRTQGEAQRLIDEHRRASGIRDPFLLILYPRQISGFPTFNQIETYRRWFAEIAHGFDNPLAGG